MSQTELFKIDELNLKNMTVESIKPEAAFLFQNISNRKIDFFRHDLLQRDQKKTIATFAVLILIASLLFSNFYYFFRHCFFMALFYMQFYTHNFSVIRLWSLLKTLIAGLVAAFQYLHFSRMIITLFYLVYARRYLFSTLSSICLISFVWVASIGTCRNSFSHSSSPSGLFFTWAKISDRFWCHSFKLYSFYIVSAIYLDKYFQLTKNKRIERNIYILENK